MKLDEARLAQELVRALRGRRSQVALSRRLGYRSNAVYAWESGRDVPTAARFLHLAARVSVDPVDALERFLHRRPEWLRCERATLARLGGLVAPLLRELRGATPIVELAARTGYSRFAISRWLKGQTEPRLHQLLALVEACTLRVLDFVAVFVDPARVPSIAPAHADLDATRRAAHDAPLSQAVLRALELEDYAALPAHEPGWIGARLGIGRAAEDSALELLLASGQIELHGGRYRVARVLTVDARRDPASTRALRAFWTRLALERLEAASPGVFAYNVLSVSEPDLQRLRELHAEYFQRMRAIVAESEPAERVVLAATQLIALDARD
ncbi:MAG: DUF4423 domain-containing protein [Myxococcales bacterium]|nr:DUF4423 domain-containing protein [Myxococcales bacterium]